MEQLYEEYLLEYEPKLKAVDKEISILKKQKEKAEINMSILGAVIAKLDIQKKKKRKFLNIECIIIALFVIIPLCIPITNFLSISVQVFLFLFTSCYNYFSTYVSCNDVFSEQLEKYKNKYPNFEYYNSSEEEIKVVVDELEKEIETLRQDIRNKVDSCKSVRETIENIIELDNSKKSVEHLEYCILTNESYQRFVEKNKKKESLDSIKQLDFFKKEWEYVFKKPVDEIHFESGIEEPIKLEYKKTTK